MMGGALAMNEGLDGVAAAHEASRKSQKPESEHDVPGSWQKEMMTLFGSIVLVLGKGVAACTGVRYAPCA